MSIFLNVSKEMLEDSCSNFRSQNELNMKPKTLVSNTVYDKMKLIDVKFDDIPSGNFLKSYLDKCQNLNIAVMHT
jgi:hypothetical protein